MPSTRGRKRGVELLMMFGNLVSLNVTHVPLYGLFVTGYHIARSRCRCALRAIPYILLAMSVWSYNPSSCRRVSCHGPQALFSTSLPCCHARLHLLFKTSILSCVDLPFSFSSRFIRVKAAARPIDMAKRGSRRLHRLSAHGAGWMRVIDSL